jgi:archaellin
MKFHIISPAWIYDDDWKASLAIRDWPGDKNFEFQTIDTNVKYVLKKKACIGSATHHPRYYHKPCVNKIFNVIQCDECKKNNLSYICEICDGNNCRIPELDYYCKKPHIIYLAAFSEDKIKVGTSYDKTFINRIIEQGPIIVCKVGTVPNKFIAGNLEKAISQEYNITERIPTSIKEDLLFKKINEENILNNLKQIVNSFKTSTNEIITNDLIVQPEYINMSKYCNISYLKNLKGNISKYSYKEGELIKGEVKANIGSFSIVEFNDYQYLVNIKKLVGWVIDTEISGAYQSNLNFF